MTALTPVYSIAKAFTAAAILREGISPDATIGSLAPVPARLGHLAIGDLLAHRSGLGDYGGWPDYRAAVDARAPAWPESAVLDRVELGEPGNFRYSNAGYLLLRLALENHTGSAFFDALSLDFEAYPFDWSRVEAVDDLKRYDPRWVYTGTFVANIDHVAGGLARVVASDIGQRMLATRVVDAPGHPFAAPGYGLGLMTDGYPARFAGHGGGGPGFTLFALATADGSAAHGEVVAEETSDRPLIERCIAALG